MREESPAPVERPAGAVFLSYASEDAPAAARICSELRAAGIEVWFDQSELRGGDVWDQKIRREIHDCALFIPVISANTASRHEGYFRLEWDLADQRTHMIARNRAFILPVCLDATPDTGADVPESFLRVQWTRLPGGATPPGFAERVSRLLSPDESHPAAQTRTPADTLSGAVAATREPTRTPLRTRTAQLLGVAGAVIAVGYFAVDRFVLSKRGANTSLTAPPPRAHSRSSKSTAPRRSATSSPACSSTSGAPSKPATARASRPRAAAWSFRPSKDAQ